MTSVLLILLPFLIGPVITIVVIVLVLRAKGRLARGEPTFSKPSKRTLFGFGFLSALGFSLFTGFVSAAVLGAVVPQTVGFAAEMACPGQVSHDSYNYSYKPGQHGTAQQFTCLVPGQAPQEITGKTFVYAGLSFSAGALVLIALLWSFVGRFVRGFLGGRFTSQQAATLFGPDVPGSGGVAAELIESVLGKLRSNAPGEAATTVYVNGKQVNLASGETHDLNRSIAAALGAAGGAEGAVGEPEPAERTVGERLRKLEELYRSGLVHREEYDAARERILKEI